MAVTELISPAGEWEASGDDKFFSKSELYALEWNDVSLSTLRVACAKFGGPVATVRDERQAILVTGGSLKPVVKIHSASGRLLGAFVWEKGSVVAMGWSDDEELLIIEDTGQVTLYDQQGTKLQHQFSFGEECRREGLLDGCLYGNGLVVITQNFSLWNIPNIREPRLQQLANPNISQAPQCMTVIEPRHTLSGAVEVLLASGDTIIVVEADSSRMTATGNEVVNLAVAPNGQFVAAFTRDGRLMVWVADFTRNLSEFSTESEAPPDSLAWCGTDSVVMAWPDILLLVGPYGDWVNFDLDQRVKLVQEIDGVRVLSDEKHEFLRRVPQSLVDVFRIGSTAPGAMLFDARVMFDQQNAKADEVLRSIIDVLPEAVATCVEAAGCELELVRQTALLKAACYGRAFCPIGSFPRKRLVEVCKLLRLLNALKQPEVGIPMTMAQLDALTPAAVMTRLLNTKHHLLAFRVAKMLNLGVKQVLTHWACAKITAAGSLADAQLRDDIVAKLQDEPGIRYTDIAAHAQALGRKGLAAMLLENETVASEQVPLLLRLGEDMSALHRASESGDTDLVHLVLFSMYRTLPLQNFITAINARPSTRSLFLAYCSRTEPELLEQMYTTMGMYEGVAEMRVRESLRKTNDLEKLREGTSRRVNAVMMGDAIRHLERAADLYGQTKEHTFQAKAAGEFAKLRRFQVELEEETGNACFVGLSVVATAQQCIKLGNQRAATRVQTEFRISDRRFWWLKAKTLAAAKDWDGLLALASDKKSPMPVDPLIGIGKDCGAPVAVTARLISKLTDSKRKAEEYTAVKMYHEAAEAAAQGRDSDMLSKIQGLVGTSSPLGLAVTQIKDRLQAGTR